MKKINLHLFDFRETNPIEALRALQHEKWAYYALHMLIVGAKNEEAYQHGIYIHLMMHHDDHGTDSKLCFFRPTHNIYGNIEIDGQKYLLDFEDDTTCDLNHIDSYYEKITYCFIDEIEDKNLSYPS